MHISYITNDLAENVYLIEITEYISRNLGAKPRSTVYNNLFALRLCSEVFGHQSHQNSINSLNPSNIIKIAYI
jgi:hypothetical protein